MKVAKIDFPVYTIAENGLISTIAVGEGRFIPVLVIDVNQDQEIEDLIKTHESINCGDVILTWVSYLSDLKQFILKIEFTKPMNIIFGIKFKIKSDYSLIDGIIESKGFYLQTGTIGDKVSSTTQDPKILIEVPDLKIKESWNKILIKTIKKDLRKKGYTKKETVEIANDIINEMRSLWKMRR